ncbi:MAG: class IV adenylate cyclase [Candidatus Thorarchaeota archaeon SMTZ1-45]|nr:MAG: hypothetical protein AM325_04935 [Candidatus Thorarchaeota archaeon SMTZ1-45]
MTELKKKYEVEVKVAIDNIEEMEDRILHLGATKINKEIQVDSYFDHPCRIFQETDEALRVRIRRPLDTNEYESSTDLVELTYKGPKVDSTTKTRTETTVSLSNATDITSVLVSLGFKHVAKLTKKRQFFSLQTVIISTDDVEDVGQFVELESIATNNGELVAAREYIFKTVYNLGLDPTQSIRESYLELYLNR